MAVYMIEIDAAFSKFKDFVKSTVKTPNMKVSLVYDMSTLNFLIAIKEANSLHKSPEDITKDICRNCDLKIEDFTKEQIEKFHKYILAFATIVRESGIQLNSSK